MQSGFATLKDILDVVVIPVALAGLALAWPAIQSWHGGRRFRLLAARELVEIAPFPEQRGNCAVWTQHLRRQFLHQKIIGEISDNRDFVLGLEPEFVYSLSQLWAAYHAADGAQWLWYLGKLAGHRYLRRERLELLAIREQWNGVIQSYSSNPA